MTLGFGMTKINVQRMRTNATRARKASIVMMNQLFDGAILAFVNEAVMGGSGDGQKIGVDTGMAAASLLPFLRTYRVKQGNDLIGILTAEIQSRQKHDSKKGYTDTSGNYNPDDERSFEHGLELGRDAATVRRGTTSNPLWTFTYQIDVGHWVLFHENTWRVLSRAAEAFEGHIVRHFGDNLLTAGMVELLLPEYE